MRLPYAVLCSACLFMVGFLISEINTLKEELNLHDEHQRRMSEVMLTLFDGHDVLRERISSSQDGILDLAAGLAKAGEVIELQGDEITRLENKTELDLLKAHLALLRHKRSFLKIDAEVEMLHLRLEALELRFEERCLNDLSEPSPAPHRALTPLTLSQPPHRRSPFGDLVSGRSSVWSGILLS